jgi:hypothetical protein
LATGKVIELVRYMTDQTAVRTGLECVFERMRERNALCAEKQGGEKNRSQTPRQQVNSSTHAEVYGQEIELSKELSRVPVSPPLPRASKFPLVSEAF